MNGTVYTAEMDDWILANYESHQWNELANIFNARFSCAVSGNALRVHIFQKYGKKKTPQYEPIHDEWLSQHYNDADYSELVHIFNKKFGKNVTVSSLNNHAYDIGLVKTTSYHQQNAGENLLNYNAVPVGTETVRGGKVYVKVADNFNPGKNSGYLGYANGGNWRRKDYHIWEQNGGKFTEDCVMVHLDNDDLNCDISNLYMCSKSVYRHFRRSKIYEHGIPLLTKCAIMRYELIGLVRKIDEQLYHSKRHEERWTMQC